MDRNKFYLLIIVIAHHKFTDHNDCGTNDCDGMRPPTTVMPHLSRKREFINKILPYSVRDNKNKENTEEKKDTQNDKANIKRSDTPTNKFQTNSLRKYIYLSFDVCVCV